MVLDGFSREEAARLCGMDRQTLRDWVHRYNKASLSWVQQGKLASWVEEGADLARDDVVPICDLIAAEFGVTLHERGWASCFGGWTSAVSPFARNTRNQILRPRTLLKNFAAIAGETLGGRAAGKPVEIWFQDEARVGQQGTLTRIWATRGARPRAPSNRRFTWVYLFGAVCPARGVGAALALPAVDIGAMNKHLIEIGKCVTAGAIALLIVDGAGWHSPKLAVPENVVLLNLPPYAPELNPAENTWEYLRGNTLSHQVWETYDAIVDACCDA